jgi:hypothetical protein
MEEGHHQSDTIDIRCPECRARFSVPPDLIDRIVECGGCDHQFRITEDVIKQSKKSYPGEKREPNTFRRTPLASVETPKDFKTINYADIKHPQALEPVSPLHIIAGLCGIGIILFGALILFLSIKPSSPLGGMPLEKQFIVAGFTSLLGMILLIYACRNSRFLAGFIGLALAAGVVSIPLFLREKPEKFKPAAGSSEAASSQQDAEATPADPVELLRERFLTRPLETEQKRLLASNSNKQAYGVYLTGMLGRYKLSARDYLIRETRAGITSHPFPRHQNDHLMVLTEVEMDLDDVAQVAGKLGKVTETHPEIHLIVVKVDNEKFVGGSDDKLNDTSHSSFYDLNLQELQSIDIGRIQRAVDRLADAEPTVLRSDIDQALSELLTKPGVTFHDSIARGLMKWSDDLGKIADLGLEILEEYAAFGAAPPEHLVQLVAEQKKPDAIPTLMKFWEANPVLWNDDLMKFGSSAEPSLLKKLESPSLSLRRACIKTLGQIGTEQSLPALREQIKVDDTEVRVLAERAIAEIEER